jgi:Domain of unknown function (DUF4278)
MKLIYRGETYDYDRTQAKAANRPQTAYDLIYRGCLYHVDPSLAKPVCEKPRSYELIYRGCTYQVTRNEAGVIATMEPRQKLRKRSYFRSAT